MCNCTKHYYATIVDAIKAVREYLEDPVMPDDIDLSKMDHDLDTIMCDLIHEINYG